MSTYKIDFRRLRQDAELVPMLEALEKGFERFDIDFFLVGAVARDIHIDHHGLSPKRATDDIDFAVLIRNESKYAELRDYLITVEGFNEYKENPLVLIWKNGKEVDLMPFEDITDNGSISVASVGLTDLKVDGFKEVYESDLPEVELEGVRKFKFCSLPGIVLLKLVAWSDRPEMRGSDVADISYIIQNFFAIHDEEIWDNHNDLFGEEDSEEEYNETELAARVLGRKIGVIVKSNKQLVSRLHQILTPTSDKLATAMTQYFDNAIEDNSRLLGKISDGIRDATESRL